MAFSWKGHKDIWKGEGIYHLTFVVAGRRPLLGALVGLSGNRPYQPDVARPQNTDVLPYEGWRKELCTSELATVRLSELGLAIHRDLIALPERYSYAATDDEPAIIICGKQFMENHLHVVIWVKKDLDKSIRQIAQGFRIGIRKIAEDMGIWRQEDGHVLEKPFIRTLARKGQLRAMIDYIHANPDNAWMRKLHPDLYTIRRNQQHGGLAFDTMGKARLLDYPDRQVIALSRSLTEEQIKAEVRKALAQAERGAVTYCAVMSDGEKAVTRAVREAGFPLVVLLTDGFPAEGTEAARFYHPGGAYHQACGEGKLYLMAPQEKNYSDPRVIALTEAELRHKAELSPARKRAKSIISNKNKIQEISRLKGVGDIKEKPLPHDSRRWRMIAGNVMLKVMIETKTKTNTKTKTKTNT